MKTLARERKKSRRKISQDGGRTPAWRRWLTGPQGITSTRRTWGKEEKGHELCLIQLPRRETGHNPRVGTHCHLSYVEELPVAIRDPLEGNRASAAHSQAGRLVIREPITVTA